MNKGPDKGKYDSALMTSAHSVYSEGFGTAYQNYWVVQAAVIHDGCGVKLETLLEVFRKDFFQIVPPKNADLSINFITWKLKQMEFIQNVHLIQTCITNLSPSDCVLFESLKNGLWSLNSEMIWIVRMCCIRDYPTADKIRLLVSHWNGSFQLEVNCIENNVDLCFWE